MYIARQAWTVRATLLPDYPARSRCSKRWCGNLAESNPRGSALTLPITGMLAAMS